MTRLKRLSWPSVSCARACRSPGMAATSSPSDAGPTTTPTISGARPPGCSSTSPPFPSSSSALLATAFLTLSVPFLLHVRQARYYAIAALATIWAIYFFFALVRDRRGALLGLVLAMTVLFHSNYLACFATAVGLGLALMAFPFDRRVTLRLAGAAVATLAINLPWLAMFD